MGGQGVLASDRPSLAQAADKVLLVIVIGLTLLAAMGWYLTWMQRAVISLQQKVIEELRRDMRGLEERISIWRHLEENAPALGLRDRKRLASVVHRESRRHDIEWHLLVAIVETESSFRPGAESRRGALGLMQLRPATAAEVASAIGVPYGSPVELYDIEVNIRLGTAYLHMLRRRFGTLDLALQAYHIGPTRMSRVTMSRGRAGGASSARMDRPDERVGARYAGKVLSYYARLAPVPHLSPERAERARAAGHPPGGVGRFTISKGREGKESGQTDRLLRVGDH